MAGPGGSEVGRVSVRVVPDTSRFAAELKAKLKKVDDDFKVNVGLDTDRVLAQFEKLKAKLAGDEVTLGVDVDRAVLGQVSRLLGQLGKGAAGATGTFGALAAAGARLGSSLFRVAAMAVVLAPLFLGLAGAILAVGGAMSAGLLTLPGVLALAVGPIAAVKLGMEGIRDAAKTLNPQVTALKTSLSATFRHGMVPVFQKLRTLFPVLSTGLNGIAQQVSRFALEMVKVVTSKEALTRIGWIFDGIQSAIRSLTPTFARFVDEFLQLLGQPIILQKIADILKVIVDNFTSFIDKAEKTDAFSNSLTSLKTVLDSVSGFMSELALSAMEFFNGAAPGLSDFFDSLTKTLQKIDWEKLGKSFGNIFRQLGKSFEKVSPADFERFVNAIVNLGKEIGEFIASGDMTKFITALRKLTDIVSGLIDTFMTVDKWIERFTGGVGSALGWLGEKLGITSSATQKFEQKSGKNFRQFHNTAVTELRGGVNQGLNQVNRLPREANAPMVKFSNLMPNKAGSAMGGMNREIGRGVDESGRQVGRVPGVARNAIGPLERTLRGSGQALMNGFISGIRSMFSKIANAAWSAVRVARRFFPFSPAKEGPFSGKGYTLYSGRALVKDWARGIEDAAPRAINEVEQMMSATQKRLSTDVRGTVRHESYGDFSASLAEAISGMSFTLDDSGGKVMAKVVNRANRIDARRQR